MLIFDLSDSFKKLRQIRFIKNITKIASTILTTFILLPNRWIKSTSLIKIDVESKFNCVPSKPPKNPANMNLNVNGLISLIERLNREHMSMPGNTDLTIYGTGIYGELNNL